MNTFEVARGVLMSLSASYAMSAAVFVVLRWRGHAVGWPVILGWLSAGVAGVGLSLALAPGSALAWTALLVVLAPWMVHALVGDVDRGHRWIAALDAAGISAIAWSLWVTRALAWAR
jgi:hypothetical protein